MKTLKLYRFTDNDGEVLIDNTPIEKIRKFFYERLDYDIYELEIEEAGELVEIAKIDDKALEELVKIVWGAEIELIKTISENDLN
jgi:hypothetical protein